MTEHNDAYPDPENVCPGCGGHVDADEYKCDKCSDGSIWGKE